MGCTGLTERGRFQAVALARRLKRECFTADILYSSVLPRAVETAEALQGALGTTEIVEDCELCELHPGECDGMSWEDQLGRYGPGESRSPDQPISPGGGSLRQFDLRLRAALSTLLDHQDLDSVALVSHGGFISAAMFALLGTPGLADQTSFYLSPAYTSLAEWSRREPRARWSLERYNDSAQLSGT